MLVGRFRDARLFVALIVTVAIFVYLVGKPIPILIWDEGRIVISTMEMRHSGMGLVTTYDHHQDLWNTKPPLLVWLMTASTALLGANEFALRLPSLISAIGTVGVVMFFLYRITFSAAVAAFAGISLGASIGFFGEHGARTADYDALLTFFTTGYLMLLFFAIHRARPSKSWLMLAGVLGAGALMTKGIAGAIPGTGFLLYLLITRRFNRVLRTPNYLIGALVAVAPILIFLILREQIEPGYLQAMIYNDAGGRFKEALDNHAGPPWYYIETTFFNGLFSLGVAAMLAPFTLAITTSKVRFALIFSLCIAAGQLIVITMTSTKLTHYYLPAYPFLAIACALAVHTVHFRLRAQVENGQVAHHRLRIATAVSALLLTLGIARAIDVDRDLLFEREHYPRTRYGALFDKLADDRAPVLAIEAGWSIPDDPHYAPELRFYMMVAREKGRVVEQTGNLPGGASVPLGWILASCDPSVVPQMKARAAEIVVEQDGCIASRERT